MQDIIEAVDRQLLKGELTPDKFIRKTNNVSRDIYIVTHHDSPNTMLEIGRLREISFREAGGGTGKEADIDSYDTAEKPFKQLIVWDSKDEEIVGGYRYIEGYNIPVNENNVPLSATSKLFHFSDQFVSDYLRKTIELGRSFVQPKYQPTIDRKKGLYFFGKFTMYPSFNRYARDVILYFLAKYFYDNEELVRPYHPLGLYHKTEELEGIFRYESYEEDYKKMVQVVRSRGESIPPLVNSYMNLSSTMKVFGTSLNPNFGNVEETAILIVLEDIYPGKKNRYITNYKGNNEKRH